MILLQHGLDPNVRFSQRTQHILLSLMDMVMNARSPADLDHVYALTLTLLQYRADPNVHIATTEPMICHSQSSVFLKKSSHQVLYYYVQVFYKEIIKKRNSELTFGFVFFTFLQVILRREELLLDPEQRYARIIILYYMAMEHRPLYACLKLLYSQAGLVPMRSALCRLIRQLYSHPRSLKQMCRVTIYNAVGRCSALSVNKLPLPGPLKEYLLSFDP